MRYLTDDEKTSIDNWLKEHSISTGVNIFDSLFYDKENSMYRDEKREIRLQISQLLADAGLNQATIKQMVAVEIQNKVERAVQQVISVLNSQCYSGDYIKEQVNKLVVNDTSLKFKIQEAVKDELRNKVINVTLEDVVRK